MNFVIGDNLRTDDGRVWAVIELWGRGRNRGVMLKERDGKQLYWNVPWRALRCIYFEVLKPE